MHARHTLSNLSALALLAGFCLTVSGQAGADKEKVLTQKEDNTTVKIAKGTILAIKLEGLPSAGYTWQVAKTNADVLPFNGKVDIEKPKVGVIGAKVMMTLRFTAKAAGMSEVELHYRRPFEKDKKPEKTFKVKVEVQD